MMIQDQKIKQREWGKTEITGPRHAFRIRMMMRKMEKCMPPPAKVLDAGCGDGAMTLALVKKGYRITAVDASRLCLERLCRRVGPDFFSPDKRNEGLSVPSVVTSLAYLDALPFPDHSFDAVISGEVLEHLDDDEAAVKELFRVLRPGGVCIVSVPADPSLWSVEDEWAGHKRRYRPEALASLFERAGFAVEDLHHWGWPLMYLYDRYLFRAWLKTRLHQGDPDPKTAGSAGANPLLTRVAFLAFSLDRLFQRVPKGIGLVGIFRK